MTHADGRATLPADRNKYMFLSSLCRDASEEKSRLIELQTWVVE